MNLEKNILTGKNLKVMNLNFHEKESKDLLIDLKSRISQIKIKVCGIIDKIKNEETKKKIKIILNQIIIEESNINEYEINKQADNIRSKILNIELLIKKENEEKEARKKEQEEKRKIDKEYLNYIDKKYKRIIREKRRREKEEEEEKNYLNKEI